jgi:exonuclease VII small subunit
MIAELQKKIVELESKIIELETALSKLRENGGDAYED